MTGLTPGKGIKHMTTTINDPLAHVEQAVAGIEKKDRGSNQHHGLRRLFAQVGGKLSELGDVIVFVDGRVAAFDPFTPPGKILEFAGKDPTRFCVFRLNPCGGAPAPLKEGNRLETADQLVVSLCTPPADGASRATAIAQDVALLGRGARNVRVSRLQEGQDALLADFEPGVGDVATCGVIVSPQYPATGPDWFLLDGKHDFPGFTGGKRGPFHEGGLALIEYSIHPPPGIVPSASQHIISVVARRLAHVRRSVA